MSDLIALAKQAKAVTYTNRHWLNKVSIGFTPETLQAFADLICKEERARIAFEEYSRLSQSIDDKLEDYQTNQEHSPELVALADRAIRARTTT